jgi:hypothetical protein
MQPASSNSLHINEHSAVNFLYKSLGELTFNIQQLEESRTQVDKDRALQNIRAIFFLLKNEDYCYRQSAYYHEIKGLITFNRNFFEKGTHLSIQDNKRIAFDLIQKLAPQASFNPQSQDLFKRHDQEMDDLLHDFQKRKKELISRQDREINLLNHFQRMQQHRVTPAPRSIPRVTIEPPQPAPSFNLPAATPTPPTSTTQTTQSSSKSEFNKSEQKTVVENPKTPPQNSMDPHHDDFWISPEKRKQTPQETKPASSKRRKLYADYDDSEDDNYKQGRFNL